MLNYKISQPILYIFITIIFFGIVIRAFNINFENLWYDEIISFWIANPNISIDESLNRHNQSEVIPFLYNLILKIYFKIFGYSTDTGRYLSLLFNILGVYLTTYLCFHIKKNNAFMLCLILLSTNIFLIKYSQELRAYSLMFFLSSLNLVLFFKLIQKNIAKKIRLSFFLMFTLSGMLLIISHPFCLIIFFSMIIFSLIEYFKFKVNLKELNFSILILLCFCIVYFFNYLNNINIYPGWIEQPGLKFYTNFYFSKFFGSRIIGLVHLLILISLLISFSKKIIHNTSGISIFVIIIFLSYFLPLMFGYILKPIIFPRYIIFVLIPIITLISILTFEIKNNLIRKTLITILIISNLGNLYTETTIQQFFKKRPNYKPNFFLVLDVIDKSTVKYFTTDISAISNQPQDDAVNDYLNKLTKEVDLNIKYISKKEFVNSDEKKIWTICLTIAVSNGCLETNELLNSRTLENKKFPGIILKMIEKN